MNSVWLLIPTLLFSAHVYADNCASVIAGGSRAAYNGDYGGYDYDGNCHKRDVSENDCRRLAGNLFVGFSADHGKGFTHCVFRPPPAGASLPPASRGSGPSTPSQGSDSADEKWMGRQEEEMKRELAMPDCTAAENEFYRQVSRLPDGADSTLIEFRLKGSRDQVYKWCTDAGLQNKITGVFGKYGELMAAAKSAHRTPPVTTPPLLPPVVTKPAPPELTAADYPGCANKASETAWCRSDAPGMSQQKSCISEPQQTGENNFSIPLLVLECTEKYLAAIATYDDNGKCTRQVVSVAYGANWTGQITSSTRIGRPPHVMDAIRNGSAATSQCYHERHDGCPCD